MKKNLIMAGMILAAVTLFSCQTPEEAQIQAPAEENPTTKAYGDKTPKMAAYIEINDCNPLIGKAYRLGSASGAPVFDMIYLFAANIHKDADGYPTIYFNDKMAPMMENVDKHIKPLQDEGIKVLLTILGDWQGIGVANLNDAQAEAFANILTYIVDTYRLDGITFDDEYSNYSGEPVSGSYGRIITKLRTKLDAKFPGEHKLINVFQWGNTGSSQINAAAGAVIDYADHGSFGPNSFFASSSIAGMSNNRWMPTAVNLGSTYSAVYLNQIGNRANQTKNGGYAGAMFFNLRNNNANNAAALSRVTQSFYGQATVIGGSYVHDWTYNPNGFEITKDDI